MPRTPDQIAYPLQRLFEELRTRGFLLGIDDYLLLVEALSQGFGLRNAADLRQVCEALWLKPTQSQRLFRELFDRYFGLEWEAATQAEQAHEQETPLPQPLPDFPTPGQDPISPSPQPIPEKDPISDPIQTNPQAQEIRLSLASSAENAVGFSLNEEIEAQGEEIQQEFLFQGAYAPISARQMEIGWRYLRQSPAKVATSEVNLPATIQAFCRTGKLDQLIFQQRQVGEAQLLVLIDWGGSMLAFHGLAQQLADSAPGGQSALPQHFYFHDVPGSPLFSDPYLRKGHPIEAIRARHAQQKHAIMIISDAGAARGTYDRQRVIDTQKSLQELRQIGHNLVWLNPVPEARWGKSTAFYVRKHLVPMFETTERGLSKAVDVLRGKPSSGL